jgi:hypothetical protein
MAHSAKSSRRPFGLLNRTVPEGYQTVDLETKPQSHGTYKWCSGNLHVLAVELSKAMASGATTGQTQDDTS